MSAYFKAPGASFNREFVPPKAGHILAVPRRDNRWDFVQFHHPNQFFRPVEMTVDPSIATITPSKPTAANADTSPVSTSTLIATADNSFNIKTVADNQPAPTLTPTPPKTPARTATQSLFTTPTGMHPKLPFTMHTPDGKTPMFCNRFYSIGLESTTSADTNQFPIFNNSPVVGDMLLLECSPERNPALQKEANTQHIQNRKRRKSRVARHIPFNLNAIDSASNNAMNDKSDAEDTTSTALNLSPKPSPLSASASAFASPSAYPSPSASPSISSISTVSSSPISMDMVSASNSPTAAYRASIATSPTFASASTSRSHTPIAITATPSGFTPAFTATTTGTIATATPSPTPTASSKMDVEIEATAEDDEENVHTKCGILYKLPQHKHKRNHGGSGIEKGRSQFDVMGKTAKQALIDYINSKPLEAKVKKTLLLLAEYAWDWAHAIAHRFRKGGFNVQSAENLAATTKWINTWFTVFEKVAHYFTKHYPNAVSIKPLFIMLEDSDDIAKEAGYEVTIENNNTLFTLKGKLNCLELPGPTNIPSSSDWVQAVHVLNNLLTGTSPTKIASYTFR